MFKIVKVRGASMRPTLALGDYLIITKARVLRPGFVVLVDHPEYGIIVKRVKSVNGETFRLEGDGHVTTTTHELGDIQMSHLIGRAKWAVKPKGFLLGLKRL